MDEGLNLLMSLIFSVVIIAILYKILDESPLGYIWVGLLFFFFIVLFFMLDKLTPNEQDDELMEENAVYSRYLELRWGK